ncbi:MAG: purine-nucleoside phosphorylase [bacterium]|nr:purine-nucleoside phosphorylase [bacterium]
MADTVKIGIILGSGLNKFTEELVSPELLFEDINTFHNLKVYKGKISDIDTVLFSGRRHYYEGYSNEEIFGNVNIAKELGINLLVITNAAGGLNKNFNVSDLMLITSHLNFINNRTPVIPHKNFYDQRTTDIIMSFAKHEKIKLRAGTYCALTGPSYETKSEIRLLNRFGVDAVGMSTIPETLFANYSGIKTIGISCITNLLSETSMQITKHEEVMEAGVNAYPDFSLLLKTLITNSNLFIY